MSQPRDERRSFSLRHPLSYLGASGLVGAVVIGLLVWGFASIADAIADKGHIIHVDARVTEWLQVHGTERGETVFSWVSWLGSPALVVIVAVAVILYARRRQWHEATAVFTSAVGASLLNVVLKSIFHRGRPEYASEFITGVSWSFPSGHAMSSAAAYGMIAYLVCAQITGRWQRVSIVATTCAVVGLVAFSRIYLGVHYLSDVVAGLLAGSVWMLVCISGYRWAARRSRGADPSLRRG